MSAWYAKSAVILGSLVMIAIRAPHGQRSRQTKVAKSHRGTVEVMLLTVAWIAFFLPLVWVVAPVFAFAEYSLHPVSFVGGVLCLALGLWLFHRSHVDLGTNWSITLELREGHRLVREGLYGYVRHPMYLSLLIYAVGQALVLPNYVVGPCYGVAMVVLFALRVGAEERMMREAFGADYESYMQQTKRLVPGLW
jgi:protein-S-isoprenylcysteine O-methyltransferase Ste14